MTLGDAAVGSTVIVAKIDGDGAYKRRIMDMGITKGSEIFIRKEMCIRDSPQPIHQDAPDVLKAMYAFHVRIADVL